MKIYVGEDYKEMSRKAANIMKKRQGTLGRGFDICDFYFYRDKLFCEGN